MRTKRGKTMKREKQIQKDFPRWVWESTSNGTGFNLIHQFWAGGNLHIKIEERWDSETGDYIGYSEPFCFMYW